MKYLFFLLNCFATCFATAAVDYSGTYVGGLVQNAGGRPKKYNIEIQLQKTPHSTHYTGISMVRIPNTLFFGKMSVRASEENGLLKFEELELLTALCDKTDSFALKKGVLRLVFASEQVVFKGDWQCQTDSVTTGKMTILKRLDSTTAPSYTEIGIGYSFHMISVSSQFYISEKMVSVGAYLEFCNATKRHFPIWLEPNNPYHIETGTDSLYRQLGYSSKGAERLPIIGISWVNALAYCKWLSAKTGKNYRLPYLAELKEAQLKTNRVADSPHRSFDLWIRDEVYGSDQRSILRVNGAEERRKYDFKNPTIGFKIVRSFETSND